jgi:hypothetical protein
MSKSFRSASQNKKGMRQVLIIPMAVLVFGFGAITSTYAQTAHVDKKKSKKSAPVTTQEVRAGASGQQAAIDPQTGTLREPTPEEARRLSESTKALLKPSKEPRAVQYPDGTISLETTEEQLDFTVVKVNPDGTLSMECVKGANAANAIVGATADSNASATKASAQTVKANDKVIAKKSARATAKRTTRKAAGKE